MGRVPAVVSHGVGSLVAAALYVVFVLPRRWELTGSLPPTAGTVLRVLTGLVIVAAAVPVALNLARVRGPEYGLPRLALRLRVGAIVAHVLAGVLIIAAAISEIWLSLDDVGPWIFGVYGAAAAIAVLGIAAFYLAFVAELPPPPEKPLAPKTKRRWFGRGKAAAVDTTATPEDTESAGTDGDDADLAKSTEDTESAKSTADTAETADPDDTAVVAVTEDAPDDTDDAQTAAADTATPSEVDTEGQTPAPTEPAPAGGLRNRRPSGKSARRRRRTRGGRAAEADTDTTEG
ncbi:hypothetical protein H7J77_03475 [Mycolicibacillus parakoreensis]|uniref:Transmembrane protein n=1 Tax=Mycolicibacillus parakoreensis TaxID=1069221 RepID=A0ABY3TZD4_9MYCO|nr:hypothetical protein [Mycolicibacillus parakoreensis]MCV7314607.1 hypothetical protein [Mycolicibacillus parakoreensis]ULN53069.1 hypothetical protein MIU77_01440 [Mycolicibacillus parakoreensis]